MGEQVSKIEQAWALSRQGVPASEIAERVGLSRRYVYRIAQYNSVAEFRAARLDEVRAYRRRYGKIDALEKTAERKQRSKSKKA